MQDRALLSARQTQAGDGLLVASAPPTVPTKASSINGWRLQPLDNIPSLVAGDLNMDVEWLLAVAGGKDTLHLLTDFEGVCLAGFAPFRTTTTRLRVAAGPLPLYRVDVQRFYALRAPQTTRPKPRSALVACLAKLAETLPSGAAVYFDAAPIGSDLQSILADPPPELRSRYFVLPWGEQYEHCKIKWSGSVEAYLKSLTSKNRSNMKRPVQKVEGSGVKLTVKRFQQPTEIDDFLCDGIAISDKTYQNRLGSGLTRGGDREAMIRFAAGRGCFLAHVLYADDQPAAFQYALIDRQTLYGLEMGYDPAYAHLQIGNALFFKMLEDLEKHRDPINMIDMMTYDSVFKRRSSNIRVPAHNYYLFPRTASGRMTYYPVLIATRVRMLGLSALRALNLSDRIKRWSRQHQRQPKS